MYYAQSLISSVQTDHNMSWTLGVDIAVKMTKKGFWPEHDKVWVKKYTHFLEDSLDALDRVPFNNAWDHDDRYRLILPGNARYRTVVDDCRRGWQKSSWLLLARLPRPVHSRALHWSISVLCNTGWRWSIYWSALQADADCWCLLPPKWHQAPSLLSKAWINRAASTATPTLHIDEFHFQPLDHPAALDPMYIHLGPNLATTRREDINTKRTLYLTNSFLGTSCETGTRPGGHFALFVSCPLSCLLLSLQINVLLSWVVFCCVVWLTRR